MKAFGIALVIVGYATFYTGASNLFSGGQGWGFLQSLLNKGTANQSGSVPGTNSGSGKSGGSSGGSLGMLGDFLSGVKDGITSMIPGLH